MKKYSTVNHTDITYEFPNMCPICNKVISPEKVSEQLNKKINLYSVFFKCPACEKCFISHYHYGESNTIFHEGHRYYELSCVGSYPKRPEQITFDDSIVNMSPSFCEIYNQAYSAEVYELNQIAGIGYRKALEFLIKDYCIYRNPNKASEIKDTFLGQVINKFIDSNKIQTLAKASAWLGNDETHYIRKFEDKDINDLKRFINATKAYITYELISDEAEELVASD